MNLTPKQKTAVITAIQKALKPQADKAREEANEELVKLYESEGADRQHIFIDGVEVGQLVIAFSSNKFEITDKDAFEEFCLANGFASLRKSIKPEWMTQAIEELETHYPEGVEVSVDVDKDASKYFKRIDDETFVIDGTNEIIPGIKPIAKKIKTTQLRGCKPDDVFPALKSLGVGVEQLLLGGAE